MKIQIDPSVSIASDKLIELGIENTLESDFLLYEEEGVLCLQSEEQKAVCCDFLKPKYLKEVRQNYGRSDSVYSFLKPLLKNKKGSPLSIVDLTAGFGRDLFKFVLAGHRVEAFEKNPLIFLLLQNGIERFMASDESVELRKVFRVDSFSLKLHFGRALPSKLEQPNNLDLVYYDPMFEDLTKKALPKKNMQMVKLVVGSEGDEEKVEVIDEWISTAESFIFKGSNLPKNLSCRVLFEKKGKGFSYYSLV